MYRRAVILSISNAEKFANTKSPISAALPASRANLDVRNKRLAQGFARWSGIEITAVLDGLDAT